MSYVLKNRPDGSAMDVDLGGVNAGEKDVCQDHHAEGLVDLPQVHLTRLGTERPRIKRRLSAGGGGGGRGGGRIAEFWILIVLFRPRKKEKL